MVKHRCICNPPCGKASDRCPTRFCDKCSNMHPLRRKCAKPIEASTRLRSMNSDNNRIRINTKTKQQYCNNCKLVHTKRKKCGPLECNIILNDLLGLNESVSLKPVDDKTKAECVNNFLKAMKDERPSSLCSVCQIYKHKTKLIDLDDELLLPLEYERSEADGRLKEYVHTVQSPKGIILCLDNYGINNGKAQVCTNCFKVLKDNKSPPFESLRHFDQGIDPRRINSDMKQLSFVETLLLNKNRTLAKVFRISSKPDYLDNGISKAQARVIRGNTITFKLPDHLVNVVAGLPRSIESLDDEVIVVFVGKVSSREEAIKLVKSSWQLKVRSKETSDWAKFIIDRAKERAQFFNESSNLEYNHEWNNAQSEDSQVPDIFTFNLMDKEKLDDDEMVDELEEKDCIGEPVISSSQPIIDSNYGSMTIDEASICQGLGIQTGLQPVNTFDKRFFVDSMTHLFPYGTDGRPKSVSIRQWGKILLRRADTRFEADYAFCFILFHTILKKELMQSTKYRFNMADFQVFDKLTFREREQFCKIISENLIIPRGLNISHNTMEALRKVKLSSSFLPKSVRVMQKHRCQTFYGLYPLLGPPAMFFTLNIDFPRNILFFKYYGIEIQTDITHRLETLSTMPARLSQFFHNLLHQTMHHLFGISYSDGHIMTKSKPGIAGTVTGFIASVETNSRRFHHAHIVLWLEETRLINTRNIIELEAKLQLFFDSVIDANLSHEVDYDNTPNHQSPVDRINSENILRMLDHITPLNPQLVRILPRMTNDDIGLIDAELLPTDVPLSNLGFYQNKVAALKRIYQIHTCMSACYKTNKQRQKKQCRMRANNMKLNELTNVDINAGIIQLSRNHPALVETSAALLYSLQSNSKLEFLVNSKAKAGAVFYAIKYALKADNFSKEVTSLAKLLQHKIEKADNYEGDDNDRRLHLLRVINMTLLGNMTFSATEASAYILGLDDFISNFTFVPIDPYSIIKALMMRGIINSTEFSDDIPDEDIRIRYKKPHQHDKAQHDIPFVFTYSQDYIHIAEDISPYNSCMFYIKDKRTRVRNNTVSFSHNHTQYQFNILRRRQTYAIPYNVSKEPPKLDSPLFPLYMLALYTPFAVRELRKHESNIFSLQDIQRMYNDELNNNKQLQTFAVNIANYHNTNKIQRQSAQEYHEQLSPVEAEGLNFEADPAMKPFEFHHDLMLSLDHFVDEQDINNTQWETRPVMYYQQHIQSQYHDVHSSLTAPYEHMHRSTNILKTIYDVQKDIHRNMKKHNLPLSKETWITNQEEAIQAEIYKSSTIVRKLIDPVAVVRLSQQVQLRYKAIHHLRIDGQLSKCPPEQISKLPHPKLWNDDLPILPNHILSMTDTLRLFTIKDPPAVFAFMLFATWVDAMVLHLRNPMVQPAPEQLKLLIQGSAGSGKTWLCKAMQWYLRQHALLEFAFGGAFQALAAVNMSNKHFSAGTLHSVFNINPISGPYKDSAALHNRFKGKIIAFIDEIYTVDVGLLGHCHNQLCLATGSPKSQMYGGISVVLFGDVNQLTLKTPIYRNMSGQTTYHPSDNHGINKFKKGQEIENLGNTVHKYTTTIVVLDKVQRQTDTDSGKQLKAMVDELSLGKISDQSLETLNSRSIDKLNPNEWADSIFLSTRHKVLDKVYHNLNKSSAFIRQQQIFIWTANDRYKNKELTPDQRTQVDNLHYNETIDDPMSSNGCHKQYVFYKDAEYRFTGTVARTLGFVNNMTCTAVKIILHPDEHVDESLPIVRLSFLPLTIIVKPASAERAVDLGYGEGNIPIFPLKRHFRIKCNGQTQKISREGFPHLRMPGILTDYAVQGRTIPSPKKGIIDIRIPERGPMQRATLLVLLSRFQSLDQIAIATPLWNTPQEKQIYCDKIRAIVTPDKDLVAEKRRQRHFYRITKSQHNHLWTIAHSFCEPIPKRSPPQDSHCNQPNSKRQRSDFPLQDNQ